MELVSTVFPGQQLLRENVSQCCVHKYIASLAILSLRIRLFLPSFLFPLGLPPPKTLYAPLMSHMGHMPRQSHSFSRLKVLSSRR